MEEKLENIPKVFITYSWSSEKHKKWVLEFATRIVEDIGVDVILDRWHGKIGQDRFQFMEENIKMADKVLVICDKNYCEKANNRQGGVGIESMILTPELYKNTKQEKFIPIALEIEKGEYLLPNFFESRFALGMTNADNFEKSFEELGRLIWDEPLLIPPTRGPKPNFTRNNDVEEKVFNEFNEERVIWLFPRGFLLFTHITFENNESWAVVADYYDYDGEWYQGTHYHDSYAWDRIDFDIQFEKLSIPKADWLWCRGALNFLKELREVSKKVNIKEMVIKKQKIGHYVFYYSKDEKIFLPKVPNEYLFYFDSGQIRDIIQKLEDEKDILTEDVPVLKQTIYLECQKFLGKDHPSFAFIKEVMDEYKTEFTQNERQSWLKKLKGLLKNTLAHEQSERFAKEINGI